MGKTNAGLNDHEQVVGTMVLQKHRVPGLCPTNRKQWGLNPKVWK